MQYRRLGASGVKVSEIALGSWLTYGGSVDEASSIKQILHAVDLGINFIDTANVYAHGNAEVVIGKALKSLERDSIFLASKVFFPMGDGPNDRGLSRKHVFEQCHQSLKRLDTPYLDLYQCHRYDPDTPMHELVRAMDDLASQGKILYWGVSEWKAEQIEDAVNTAKAMNALAPVSNQPCYNMLTRRIEESVVPTSWKHGLGQVVFSPLAQGVLTGKYESGKNFPKDSRGADDRTNVFMLGNNLTSDANLQKARELKSIASDLNLSSAQLALAWCLRLKEVSSVICGATQIYQIDDNVKASGVKLSQDILDKIEGILASANLVR
ncbi:MAG: aldo/keto reductase family protein [Candidatus Obscuribacterales bacterium]|nr:aldo/keto reductase family protein [Candidatus Obscuribacterales bacterium]